MRPMLLESRNPIPVKVIIGHGKNRVITTEIRLVSKWNRMPGASRLRVGGPKGPRIRPYKKRGSLSTGTCSTKKHIFGRAHTQK